MEKNIYSIIQDWHKLLENGTISENEFLAKKNELLNSEKIDTVIESVDRKKIPILKLSIILGVLFLAFFGIYFYQIKIKGSDYSAQYSDTKADSNKNELDDYLYETDNDKYGTYDETADNFGYYVVDNAVTDKAYFHENPRSTRKRKAYLTDKDNFIVEKIHQDFGYVEFTNSKGTVTKGWLNMQELKQCEYCK